ncbi:iron ABC transporter permease [Desemzia sp. RIT804]|uniref:FecCD family ABC transporter permease n=1 Tax=Desemzia sp. RIT 804 TaxID=2810209 RepID=UPI0019511E47|nr:iron ABC transporter permease [Desemzia sp. RIT 804]MBM6614356.1 iron ABC transporter permease [Desemzia sp. RIT 804]
MKEIRIQKIVILLVIFFIVSAAVYLSWGSYQISFADIFLTFIGRGNTFQETALLNLRLPRMIVAICVGVALATSGGIIQTITKNELADPGIIGINAGAAVAAILVVSSQTIYYYHQLGSFSIYLLPFSAIIGAAVSAGIIYFLSSHKGIKPKKMILVGLGINAGLSAFMTFFIFRGGVGEYNRVLIWTSGSLWGTGWEYAKILLPLVCVLFGLVLLNYKKLDVLQFSDEHITSLGLNRNNERKKLLTYAVVLAGGATAFAGNVGFIGLISPNIAKKLVGGSHKHTLLVSALISAIIMLCADAVSRNLFSPIEIPVGIIISIFGVPYFMYLIIKEN